jgi:signal transduction histidine kinase/HAMP domain-containing protein
MYFSLRIKVLGLLFLLIAGLAIIFSESAVRLISEKTEETFEQRLIQLTDSVKSYWESEVNQVLRTATLYSESEKIVNYSVYGLSNLLQRELQRLIDQTGFLDMEIQYRGGTVLSARRGLIARNDPLDERDPRLTLSRIEIAALPDSLEIRAIVPVHKLGEFVGLLILRRVINDARLHRMARNLQAEITISTRGNVTGSSLEDQERRDMILEIYRLGDRPPRLFSTSLAGKIHSVGLIDLGETVDRHPIRVFCAISQVKMRSLVEEARSQHVHLTAWALAVALFLAVVFSERVLISRIRAIRDGSNLIAQGNLELHLPADRLDEIGDLARSFNGMAANLKANRDELQETIERLETLKNYIENILGSLYTCVITWNLRGRIETVNPAAERELGEIFPHLPGLRWQDFWRPLNRSSRRNLVNALKGLIKQGAGSRQFDLEFDLGSHRGVIVMEGVFTYLRDANHAPYGIVLTLDNITQRKIIEQQLYHADKLSSIGQLAASVAHEIKNPLASIKTLGQLLQEDTPPSDGRREYIDVIVSEVNRLNGVVEQLLKYARPEGSKFRLVRFAEVIGPVLALVHHEAERNMVTLTSEYPSDLEVFVDAEKIKQVFLNLIFNAIQAMEERGTVTIRAFHEAGSPWTVCQISDSGAGMSEPVLAKVFEPFFTTKQRGTGLGLAIVKKIIDLHGGKIQVSSQSGHGTTFTILLPPERKDS